MSDVFPKFIITDGKLVLSKCTFHKELILDESEVIKGGGWFIYNSEANSFTFHGTSHEFGSASLEDIQQAVNDDNVFTNPRCKTSIAKQYKLFYDTQTELIPLNEGCH